MMLLLSLLAQYACTHLVTHTPARLLLLLLAVPLALWRC